ncbi:MAG: STAS domain-containing protein [Acidimicrobiales bacterium]
MVQSGQHRAVVAESEPRRLWSGGVGPAHGEVRAEPRGDVVAAVIEGSLCLVTSAGVVTAIEDLLDDVDGQLIIDLSDVSFCDAHGARSLMGLRQHCEDHDVELVLTDPSAPVVRIFDRTRISQSFDVDDEGKRWRPRGTVAGPGRRVEPRRREERGEGG